MVERVADFLPALVNIKEGLDFQHGADTTVPGALVPALEQPAIDLLAFEPAGFDDLAELGIGIVQQITHQPQIQRMDFGDKALVGQVIAARSIAAVKPFEAFVGELFGALGRLEVRTHKVVEALLAVAGKKVAVHGGQADRRGAHAVEEGFQTLACVLFLVLLPELEQEGGAFAVGKLGQVLLAARIFVVLEQLRTVVGARVRGVAHQITHQANEWQVDRLAQGVAQSGITAVIFFTEIIEGVQPTAGEKRLAGAG